MLVDSCVSLLPVVAQYFADLLPARVSYAVYGGDLDKEDCECETEDRLVPVTWVVGGLGGSVVIGTVLVWLVFGDEGIKPWATLIGFVMGGLMSILG